MNETVQPGMHVFLTTCYRSVAFIVIISIRCFRGWSLFKVSQVCKFLRYIRQVTRRTVSLIAQLTTRGVWVKSRFFDMVNVYSDISRCASGFISSRNPQNLGMTVSFRTTADTVGHETCMLCIGLVHISLSKDKCINISCHRRPQFPN